PCAARPARRLGVAGEIARAQAAQARGGGSGQQDGPDRLGHDGARRGLPPAGDSLAARGAEGSTANEDGYRSSRRVEQSVHTSGRYRPRGCLEPTRGSHLGQRSWGRTTGRTHERRRPSAYFSSLPACTPGAVHTWYDTSGPEP